MKAKHWYVEKRESFEQYEKYVDMLEHRYSEALDELKLISVGATIKDEMPGFDHGSKLQWRAVSFLRNLCQKPKVTKPTFYL